MCGTVCRTPFVSRVATAVSVSFRSLTVPAHSVCMYCYQLLFKQIKMMMKRHKMRVQNTLCQVNLVEFDVVDALYTMHAYLIWCESLQALGECKHCFHMASSSPLSDRNA